MNDTLNQANKLIIYQIKVFEWKAVEALNTINLVVSQT